jgi:hypothetical protein
MAVYDAELRHRAGFHAALLKLISETKSGLLDAARACIDASITSQDYTEFLPVVQAFRTHQATDWLMEYNWGETPSLWRKFVDANLHIGSQHLTFSRQLHAIPSKGG